MKILAKTKDMPREEWLALRRSGIGGSDAGAICGLNPFRSAIDVWSEKTAETPGTERDSEAMRVGRDLEDYVAKRFCEMTGKKVHRKNAMMQSEEDPFMIANIDRMVVGENALLECKTANAYAAEQWKDGKCPEFYEVQCHHYMAVTGTDKVYLACLIMGIDFVICEIARDEEVISSLVSIEKDFWEKYVLPKRMPPPDGSDSAGNAIKEMYTASKAEVVELPDFEKQIKRYDEITGLMDTLKREKDQIKQEIMLEMEDCDTAYVADRKITWKSQKGHTTIDSKRLKAEMPEVYEQYSKVGNPTRVFRIW